MNRPANDSAEGPFDPSRYETDKLTWFAEYQELLAPLRHRVTKMLELGVLNGDSMRLWADFFPAATIVGLDINAIDAEGLDERVHIYKGSQSDREILSTLAAENAPEGFDLIIDDASHIADQTREGFWHLFDNHLKDGGLYVIEDWAVAYQSDWTDGREFRPRSRRVQAFWGLLRQFGLVKTIPAHTHCYGMVGFVKELVDAQGMGQLLAGNDPWEYSKFKHTLITCNAVYVTKAEDFRHAGA